MEGIDVTTITSSTPIEYKRSQCIMSRKRLKDIRQFLLHKGASDSFVLNENGVDELIHGICVIMMFDPNLSLYTKEIGQKISERRREIAALTGKSIFEISGAKASYDRRKQKDC